MDARLFTINGRQVIPLVQDDLPVVSRALTAAIRGLASVTVDYHNAVSLVHIFGGGVDLYLRGEDWVKILPYFENGFLSPLDTAVRTSGLPSVVDLSEVDITYSDLNRRVLGLLKTLFTDSFPTPP